MVITLVTPVKASSDHLTPSAPVQQTQPNASVNQASPQTVPPAPAPQAQDTPLPPTEVTPSASRATTVPSKLGRATAPANPAGSTSVPTENAALRPVISVPVNHRSYRLTTEALASVMLVGVTIPIPPGAFPASLGSFRRGKVSTLVPPVR